MAKRKPPVLSRSEKIAIAAVWLKSPAAVRRQIERDTGRSRCTLWRWCHGHQLGDTGRPQIMEL